MTQPFFSIKICGVRTLEDIDAVALAGADAIGLNFFPPSIRHVDAKLARQLADRAISKSLKLIGVFVNHDWNHILQLASECRLDAVQLHGDERISEVARQKHLLPRILRAVRFPRTGLTVETIKASVQPWQELGCTILLDADAGVDFGGSGQTLEWSVIHDWKSQCNSVHSDWVLAGGLTPGNVSRAIEATGAKSVDVASGVEFPKGTKSNERICEFVRGAKSAWRIK